MKPPNLDRDDRDGRLGPVRPRRDYVYYTYDAERGVRFELGALLKETHRYFVYDAKPGEGVAPPSADRALNSACTGAPQMADFDPNAYLFEDTRIFRFNEVSAYCVVQYNRDSFVRKSTEPPMP